MSGGDEEAQIDRLLIDLLVNIFALFTCFEDLAQFQEHLPDRKCYYVPLLENHLLTSVLTSDINQANDYVIDSLFLLPELNNPDIRVGRVSFTQGIPDLIRRRVSNDLAHLAFAEKGIKPTHK
ncbi:Uncharacterized protein Fot_10219 [Forsythia ovata]|uniref:Uncharacterized protein n=1 Tax=Forsythia ovata TaxID=205694 RepID=A0ABD1WG80_9LAMI